jgi:hypothetical protein
MIDRRPGEVVTAGEGMPLARHSGSIGAWPVWPAAALRIHHEDTKTRSGGYMYLLPWDAECRDPVSASCLRVFVVNLLCALTQTIRTSQPFRGLV